MPLAATDFYQPATNFVPFILEDNYLKGGYRVFATIADRDQFLVDAASKSFGIEQFDARKKMMLCGVMETPGVIYYLDVDKETWLEYESGLVFTTETPLEFLGENQDRLSINPNYLVPQQGKAVSKVLTVRLDGTIGWEYVGLGAGQRVTRTYQPLNSIAAGEEHPFELNLGLSVLLAYVEVNTPDFELKGFTTAARTDRNPYKFVSSPEFIFDEGITNVNGEYINHRRFSFMLNLSEAPSTLQYFTLKNVGAVDSRPTVTITALTLQ